jgi:hypothetical protein
MSRRRENRQTMGLAKAGRRRERTARRKHRPRRQRYSSLSLSEINMTNRRLRKAVVALLGTTALGTASLTAQAAQSVYTPNGSGGWVAFSTGDPVGALTGTASQASTNGGIYTWDGHNNTSMDPSAAGYGWGHNAKFYYFELTTASDITITQTELTNTANFNPAFTIWKTAGYTNPGDVNGNGHSFEQTGLSSLPGINNATPWLSDPNSGGATDYLGYANTGPTGWINGAGKTIANGQVGAGFTGSFSATTGGSVAQMILQNLAIGKYLIAAGSNTACGSFGSNTLAACPTSGLTGSYSFSIAQSAATPAPVPIPAAVWLFGSALAGLGVIGQRKDRSAA